MAEGLTHRVRIERVDCGTALARLEPAAGASEPHDGEAILALAHRSCAAAMSGIADALPGVTRCRAAESKVTHLRTVSGSICAAALVDRELPQHLTDDLRRDGSARARVHVALVDAAGEAVAFGTFDYDVAHG